MLTVRIGFLGQCLVRGYDGVDRSQTFPEVARRRIETERPGLRVVLGIEEFHHPADLPRRLRAAARARHDLLIVEAPAFFLVSGPGAIDVGRFPKSVRTAYDRVRHLRDVSRHFLAAYPGLQLVRQVETSASALASNMLRPLARRYPRPTLQEYEVVLDDAVRQVREVTGTRLLLVGPSGFNPDQSSAGYPPDALEIYENVNAMVKRVAASHSAPMLDRMEVVGSLKSSIYLPGWQRYSAEGHRVTGNVLAEWLLRNGLG